ncbi:sensor histidine kinase [Carboxylicivirga marina]|uniref:histidine kinase n=1 Tax=Carboxylicivirga marina TaxID=2800988 RepID=A0ABS1HE03_9BACT|nr:ATP-binding protein [Carboxylicivirga marina]MBK3515886.1 HAMP domain-containing protein [Carboxylicivirga marina]
MIEKLDKRLNKFSFRVKITIPLILIIGTLSYVSFRLYTKYIQQEIYENVEHHVSTSIELLQEPYLYTIKQYSGSIIKTLMDDMEDNEHVMDVSLLRPEEFIDCGDEIIVVDSVFNRFESLQAHSNICVESYYDLKEPFSRMVIKLDNSPSCVECHLQSIKTLGYIAIDYSLSEAEESLFVVQRFSIFFTVLMIGVIVLIVIFMHYKFVRTSLVSFHRLMKGVNNGDLTQRLAIPKSKELGELGANFNEMLDNFQNTQNELLQMHKNELRTTRRLATLGEMSARLAHEIRNPLTGIANAIEVIVNDETSCGGNKQILEEIQRQTVRVNGAITNLLKYSRESEVRLKENDINELIKSIVFFLSNQKRDNQVDFKLDLGDDIPLLLFDYDQLENVLTNLGINATQAIESTGEVVYSTRYDSVAGKLKIKVLDTGKGIPEDVIAKVFNPFYTTRSKGTGLGLAIAKEIINKHGGKISVKNNKGLGCTFIITLLFNEIAAN